MYRFADGSFFGVAEPDEDERPAGVTSAEVAAPDPGPDGFVDDGRIVGFRVASLDEALAALAAAGFPAIDGHENEWSRYAHVAGPDGRLYEFVELLDR